MSFFGPRFTEREFSAILLRERFGGFSFIVTPFKIGKTNGAYI